MNFLQKSVNYRFITYSDSLATPISDPEWCSFRNYISINSFALFGYYFGSIRDRNIF